MVRAVPRIKDVVVPGAIQKLLLLALGEGGTGIEDKHGAWSPSSR
jgi:hypothetical protein